MDLALEMVKEGEKLRMEEINTAMTGEERGLQGPEKFQGRLDQGGKNSSFVLGPRRTFRGPVSLGDFVIVAVVIGICRFQVKGVYPNSCILPEFGGESQNAL